MNNITHLLPSGLGGIGTYFRSMIEGRHSSACRESAIFYGVADLREEYADLCNEHSIPFHYVPKKQGLDLKSYYRINRCLCQQAADIVVIHTASAVPAALWYGKRRKARLIFVEHTPADARTAVEKKMSWWANRYSDYTVAFSEIHRNDLVESFGPRYRGDAVKIISKGIDLSFFKPAETASVSNTVTIGMQGRLEATKDHPTLIRAFSELCKRDSPALQLKFAGEGADEPSLRNLAEELGVANQVHFLGVLERPDLLKFLQSLDIYVHATHGETICYSIMEAQGVGLPVVASNVKGVAEVLTNDSDALLFEDSNPEELLNRLRQLVENPDLRVKFGAASRDLVERKFSQASMADAFQELYQLIIAK